MTMRRHRRNGRGRLAGRALLVLGAVGLAWTAGLVAFAESIPDAVADPDRQTDAIVVLTGGSGRLAEGLELLEARRGRVLFVSGVYQGVDVKQLLRLSRQAPEELECCVVPGHGALNTEGNAAETAEWAEEAGVHSLRLVTSSYHMPRSLMEFRAAMPDVEIVPHPVFTDTVKQDYWWLWPGTASLIVGEYNKVLLAWTRSLAVRLFIGDRRRPGEALS